MKRTGALALVACLTAAAAAANSEANPSGAVVSLSIGAGAGRAEVAEASHSDFGPVLGLQAGVSTRRLQVVGDVTLQPFRVANPLGGESFIAVYALAAVQAKADFGGYLRAGLGPAWFHYSGTNVFVANDRTWAWGLNLGYERQRPGRFRPGIEALGRWSPSSDGELGARLFGLQITATWYH